MYAGFCPLVHSVLPQHQIVESVFYYILMELIAILFSKHIIILATAYPLNIGLPLVTGTTNRNPSCNFINLHNVLGNERNRLNSTRSGGGGGGGSRNTREDKDG